MKRKHFIIRFLILILMSSPVFGQQREDIPPPVNYHIDPLNPEYVPGEILLKINDNILTNISKSDGIATINIVSIDAILGKYFIEEISLLFNEKMIKIANEKINRDKSNNVARLENIYLLKFRPETDINELIIELEKCEEVEYAEPNYFTYSMITPNDPIYQTGALWHIDSIHAPAAWDSTTSDTSQIICIIDTGVDWMHPDLDDNIWTNWLEIPDNGLDDDNNGFVDDRRGWDFINLENDPRDDNGHGTHVAGLAAAETDNSIGTCGIAWHAKIMPVKVLQSSGVGNSADFAQGILYAYNSGATIINMSLGSYGESITVKNALEYAYSTSVLVAAAGNDCICLCGSECPVGASMFPACYPFVIGVQASNFYSDFTYFSNYDISGPIISGHSEGYNYEIRAPGIALYSTFPGGNYHALSGTSMACPLVSGSAALLKSHFPGISNEQLFVRLIQGADTGALDIHKSLIMVPVPDLYYNNYLIVDTLLGGDDDGVADAGETIQLYFNIKNAGAWADSVWCVLRLGEFEDTTVAEIIDSTCFIGDMSAYSLLSGESNPFVIEINSNVANNRDIVFEYELGSANSPSFTDQIVITVENGEELLGIMDSTLVLTPDKLWLVNGSFKVSDSGSLIILPGTSLHLNKNIINQGIATGIGLKDSIIYIQGPGEIKGGFQTFEHTYFYIMNGGSHRPENGSSFINCVFEDADGIYYGGIAKDCIYKNVVNLHYYGDSIIRCNFENIMGILHGLIVSECYLLHCNFSRITSDWGPSTIINGYENFYSNNFITNTTVYSYTAVSIDPYFDIPPQYWGTTDTSTIDEMIFDFYENPALAIVNYQPILTAPSAEAHGIVWKVHVNDVDPQEDYLDPIGVETVKFDVYFNRPMDTSYTPWLTFGIQDPHTQHTVADNASWNADSTIWTAFFDADITTGDGMNYIRVSQARDNEDFEIPIEDNERFKFIIQAAQSASLNYTATPGIGKVTLNWPVAITPDILGYNLYRFYNLTDSTYSDTSLISNTLLVDTTYTDYNVIPDTSYNYIYTVLGTDMEETNFSKVVTAIPFNTATGDANGDQAVNVLDITTIVSYMLSQNPQPFLFDAADVNYDNEINVLDIVGVVQLINGTKGAIIQRFPKFIGETAYYSINENGIQLNSKGNVAALQFKIEISHLVSSKFVHSKLEAIQIFSKTKGFEFAFAITDDHIIGILYSFLGEEIPEGEQELFKLKGLDLSEIEVIEIFGGELSGNYVPVLKKMENVSALANEASLQVYPNPFSYHTQINYLVPEDGFVNMRIFDLKGIEVNNLLNTNNKAGKYTINWNGTDNIGRILKTGIYLLQLRINTLTGRYYDEELKIVLSK